MEFGTAGVRVNAICPGAVAIPLLAGNPKASADDINRAGQGFESMTPIGHVADPSELVSAALFLASDDSSFVTGQALVVDGGVTAGIPYADQPEFFRVARPIRHHRPTGR